MIKNNEIAKKDIDNKLKAILENHVKIDLDKLDKSVLNEHLLGRKFRLAPRDMLYILDDIENEFNITIPQNCLADGSFSSYNSILSIIKSVID
ncbi:peptide maturation system acyl carrier-related protein [Wukongibacter baidiensis]|uniref:peptide maturation system acyl carrier-related protein n=1 Tax=Wukongibacter baidiensis TaxID=1723361 RepID=UPI003D7FBA06